MGGNEPPGPDEGGGKRTRRQGPQRQGEDRVTAIPRRPGSAFIYWELSGGRSAEALRELGPDVAWMLRILNVSDGTSSSLRVAGLSGSCYVDLDPGQTYGFELGARKGDRWRTVCRTERVQMPVDVTRPAGGKSAAGVRRTDSRRAPKPEVAQPPGLTIESTPLGLNGSSPGVVAQE